LPAATIRILQNPEIVNAYTYAKDQGKKIHFLGLVSDGGVHSSLDHLFKLIDIAQTYGISDAYVHCFMDGRDTDPKSGKGFIEQLDRLIRSIRQVKLLRSLVATTPWIATNAGSG
jgi:2,3-bisphosphoglycerate-independent phosphoglycerate mutase